MLKSEQPQVELCDRTFASEAEYFAVNDAIIPKATENNQCALCATESLTKTAFAYHRTKHTVGFMCSICDASFTSRSKVRQHTITRHADFTT